MRSVYVYIEERGGRGREKGEVERERKKTIGIYVVEGGWRSGEAEGGS